MSNCKNIQKSLDWCIGTPELPGIMRTVFYISKNMVAKWPEKKYGENGQVISSKLSGNFVLVADAVWHRIAILSDKSQLTSEAQGEIPSQTQLNKLVALHPGVGAEATNAAAYLNNTDSVFIVQDMKSNYRVVGSDMWPTKCTVAQDNGQGTTGSTSTTISVEATDEIPAPFYLGEIVTGDGVIYASHGDGQIAPAGRREISFTPDGATDDEVAVISGSYQTGSAVSYEGKDYYTILKIETGTQVSFATEKPCTMTVVFGASDTRFTLLVDGVKNTGATGLLTTHLDAGEHLLAKADAGTIAAIILTDD